jgi:putative tryptophan/tyrosine transport system substrate-binding protein
VQIDELRNFAVALLRLWCLSINLTEIMRLADRHRFPAIYGCKRFVTASGLMSYGDGYVTTWQQVGVYVGKILKGAKPSDLPIVQPTKFELIINLKTAKALGLTVATSLLACADEVIE